MHWVEGWASRAGSERGQRASSTEARLELFEIAELFERMSGLMERLSKTAAD